MVDRSSLVPQEEVYRYSLTASCFSEFHILNRHVKDLENKR